MRAALSIPVLTLLTAPLAVPGALPEDPVDFAAQVRPILEARCHECHGAAKQKAGLRLDLRSSALAGAYGGEEKVILPGNGEGSPLWRRVAGLVEGEDRMPPKGEPLAEVEMALLRRWIDEGASWPDEHGGQATGPLVTHWSYVAPVKAEPPAVRAAAWCRGPIDRFVLARLEREGLTPAPEADRETLLRRVTLDLTGLPPTPTEIDAFLVDGSPAAYERVVDRLLASPAYAEHMARMWLDLARYADSNGYEKDDTRVAWRWRDWVIEAFDRDLPFDRFTLEQLAGDLLERPTLEQRVATGFHRNTMTNLEGGVDPEEFRSAAVIDRVNTTATVWLGTTLACAQCHNHKYDPFSQKEYFQLYAFLDSTEDSGSSLEPRLRAPTPEQEAELERLQREVDRLEGELTAPWPDARGEQEAWEVAARFSALAPPDREGLPGPVRAALVLEPDERGEDQRAVLERHWRREVSPRGRALKAELDAAGAARDAQEGAIPMALVLRELEDPRETRLFVRGSFLSPGEAVERDVPAVLNPWPEGAPRNRLGLARWLVDPANPLTARVTVNRFWARLFGRGIVASDDDFGSRGDAPTHPELLDWLAVDFVEDGWSVKRLQRRLVTSATYRQGSRVTPELLERDPHELLLARAPRLRLEAEVVRDCALAAAGLLERTVGGPSAFPIQPAGIWASTYSSEQWVTASDATRWRRGLYVFLKRTSPYPSFLTFDGTSRELACTRRPRTNTPLQALTLLNDPVYVEAAVGLARRVMREVGDFPVDMASHAFRLVNGRFPRAPELDVLLELFEAELQRFRGDPDAARELTALPVTVPAELEARQAAAVLLADAHPEELAAWAVVANTLFNTDEFVTRE